MKEESFIVNPIRVGSTEEINQYATLPHATACDLLSNTFCINPLSTKVDPYNSFLLKIFGNPWKKRKNDYLYFLKQSFSMNIFCTQLYYDWFQFYNVRKSDYKTLFEAKF